MPLVRSLLIALLLTSLSGCSYLFMEPPPPQHARLDSFQCRQSRGTPTLDVIYGIGQVAGALGILLAADELKLEPGEAALYAGSNATIGVVALASAAYGFGAAQECTVAFDQLALRQAQARERQAAIESVLVTTPAPAQPTPSQPAP